MVKFTTKTSSWLSELFIKKTVILITIQNSIFVKLILIFSLVRTAFFNAFVLLYEMVDSEYITDNYKIFKKVNIGAIIKKNRINKIRS